MRAPDPFMSWLAVHFDRFVALRRASGVQYESQRLLLRAFDRWICEHAPSPPLLNQTLTEYLTSLERLSPRGQGNVIAVVWPGVSYALLHGAPGERLPAPPPKPANYLRLRQPRILPAADVTRLMTAARALPPADALRGATVATLLGLLYTTGVRIGEALALEVGDLDTRDHLLTIRKGKFGKARLLVLRESTVKALAGYLDDPRRRARGAGSTPLFLSGRSRPLSYSAVHHSLRDACVSAGIGPPWPRPHDFRHSFAVNRVAAWYAEGREINALLPALSTYLGHVSVENTRVYLTANGILLETAAARFARSTVALDQVRP